MNQVLQPDSRRQVRAARSVEEALAALALVHGEKTAFTWISTGEREEVPRELSFREFYHGVVQTANFFRSLGVGRQDVVAYMLPSLIETHLVLWGAETAGIACPVNFLLQPEQIADLLRSAGAKLLVSLGPKEGADIWQKAVAVQNLLPGLRLLEVGSSSDAPGRISFDERLAQPGETLRFADRPEPQTVAAYFHTGGTTGAPKLVQHTHLNQLTAAFGAIDAIGLCESDTATSGLPLFHVGGTIFCSLSNLLAGARTVILSPQGFRNPLMVRNYWKIVEKYRVTVGGAVPTTLSVLAEQDIGDADISSLRVMVSGAAALPAAVAEKLEQLTGRDTCELFGMTEAGGVIAVDSPVRGKVRGSVGFAIPGCEVESRKLQSDGSPGERCDANEAGVLVLNGSNVTPGYKDSAQNAANFTRDGWFITGDMGYVDTEGRIYITGRAKDLIIRSGHNIDPAMIEDAFLSHPAVQAVAAVAMPDSYAGELPAVYVVLKPGQQASVGELREHAESRISERPAYPKQIFIVDGLPVTGVGKVFKPALRNDCAEKLFREILSDIPYTSLAVTENAKRGRIITLALPANSDTPEIRRRVDVKMKPYLATVEWIRTADGH